MDNNLTCLNCGFTGLDDGCDGFFYCQRCGSQAADIIDTANDINDSHVPVRIHKRAATVNMPELSQSKVFPQSDDGLEPTMLNEFPSVTPLSFADYHSQIRFRYVLGMQTMIELQVKTLVEKYNVTPLVVGMIEPIWLRFVASTRLFAENWADKVIFESETQSQGEESEVQPSNSHRNEPCNLSGKRAVLIWYRALNKAIPLHCSLAISFLVCHLAREAILPTDIVKSTVEGELPYFTAFLEIEKLIGPPPEACPLSSAYMFRPTLAPSLGNFESIATSLAQTIGLELPPVNFYAVASRYLRQLSLPVEIILPHACQICEWSMPQELWLSPNQSRLPTRACVMSLLIISIRILYNINGYGKWEMSLSQSIHERKQKERTSKSNVNSEARQSPTQGADDSDANSCGRLSGCQQFELDATELLLGLEAKYSELIETSDYCKDLPAYLRYCKDVVFAGLEPSSKAYQEKIIIEDLWDFYQRNEDFHPLGSGGIEMKRRNEGMRSPKDSENFKDEQSFSNPSQDCFVDNGSKLFMRSNDCSLPSVESHKERAIRQMKENMEENKFCYIQPRFRFHGQDYIHYTRKKTGSGFIYAVHADYYILLRSCARVAQIDMRILHSAVLRVEKRLELLEKNIDYCLKVKPWNDVCKFCHDESETKSHR